MFFSKQKEFRINKFWEWFKGYAPTIKTVTKENADLILDLILEELQRIRSGLAIEITSSNFPRFERNLNTGGNNYDETKSVIAKNAVHHGGAYNSRIVLPIRVE